MFQFWIINFFFLISAFICIDSYKTGAPIEVCGTMTPHHVNRNDHTITIAAQNTTSPFVLKSSSKIISSLPSVVNSNSTETSVPFLTGKINKKHKASMLTLLYHRFFSYQFRWVHHLKTRHSRAF